MIENNDEARRSHEAQHRREHKPAPTSQETLVACEWCGEKFQGVQGKILHQQGKRGQPGCTRENPKKNFKRICPNCLKLFSRKSRLKEHLNSTCENPKGKKRREQDEGSFHCPYETPGGPCPKILETKGEFLEHREIEHGIPPLSGEPRQAEQPSGFGRIDNSPFDTLHGIRSTLPTQTEGYTQSDGPPSSRTYPAPPRQGSHQERLGYTHQYGPPSGRTDPLPSEQGNHLQRTGGYGPSYSSYGGFTGPSPTGQDTQQGTGGYWPSHGSYSGRTDPSPTGQGTQQASFSTGAPTQSQGSIGRGNTALPAGQQTHQASYAQNVITPATSTTSRRQQLSQELHAVPGSRREPQAPYQSGEGSAWRAGASEQNAFAYDARSESLEPGRYSSDVRGDYTAPPEEDEFEGDLEISPSPEPPKKSSAPKGAKTGQKREAGTSSSSTSSNASEAGVGKKGSSIKPTKKPKGGK